MSQIIAPTAIHALHPLFASLSLRSLGISALALVGAALANYVLELLVPKMAKYVTARTDKASTINKVWQLRRVETFLSLGTAVARALIISAALYVVWRVILPSSAPIALVGVSSFFIVLGYGTVVPLLSNVSYGAMMVGEQWFNVGDHITVALYNVSGVVEQITLRSTKLRSLEGESIWIHNQHINAVRVTTRGVRTVTLDIFVDNLDKGKLAVEQAIRTLPTGPTMVAQKLAIAEIEKLGDGLWQITASGATTPGREWLIEDFAIKAINKYDSLHPEGPSIVHGPIAHYSDATAEHRFRRTIRARA